MKIYLIGMPGSGKTFLGRKLAQALKLQFTDLDESIEKKEQQMIRQIIQEKGETYFRECEQELLHQTEHKNNFVISCGGGTPIFYNNMEWMKKHGIVIWLNTPLPIISERILKNITRRPLFMGLSKEELNIKIEDLLKKRNPIYKKAHISIEINLKNKSSLSSVIQDVIAFSARMKH